MKSLLAHTLLPFHFSSIFSVSICLWIFFSLAKRCQLRLAGVLHKGILENELISLPGTVQPGASMNMPDILPTDVVSDSVTLRSTEYKANMLLVLEVHSQDRIIVGWIKKAVCRGSNLFFVVKKYTCVRDKLQYFQSASENPMVELVSSKKMKSFKPLIPRGTEFSFLFFLVGKLVDDEID